MGKQYSETGTVVTSKPTQTFITIKDWSAHMRNKMTKKFISNNGLSAQGSDQDLILLFLLFDLKLCNHILNGQGSNLTFLTPC